MRLQLALHPREQFLRDAVILIPVDVIDFVSTLEQFSMVHLRPDGAAPVNQRKRESCRCHDCQAMSMNPLISVRAAMDRVVGIEPFRFHRDHLLVGCHQFGISG